MPISLATPILLLDCMTSAKDASASIRQAQDTINRFC